MRNSASVPIALGVGLVALGAVIFYFRLRKKKSDDPTKREDIVLKFELPNSAVPYVAGKNEETLRKIEQSTGTKVSFTEKGTDRQVCEVRGATLSAVEQAQTLIKEKAKKPPTLLETMVVPVAARGKILGHCGEMLEEIKAATQAKVWIEQLENEHDHEIVKFEGTQAQINAAKILINEKVSLVQPPATETSEPREVLPPKTENLKANNAAGQMEVYVSAVVSPSKFYVQILGSQSSELDLLVEEMTKYYGLEENRNRHVITKPVVGQLVAAKFEGDERFYRARVVTIEPNPVSYKTVCDLFFPDYGDNLYVYPSDIFELKTEFLGLKYQAVECFLAYVKPLNVDTPDQWSQKANDRFDELVYVAQWKRLISKTVTHRSTDGKNQIPGVELYDTELGRDIDIAQILVNEGLAQRSTTGYFGDLLNSSVLNDTPNSFPPLPKFDKASSTPQEVTPTPLAMNIQVVTEKTLLDGSGEQQKQKPKETKDATVDFLSSERQQNGSAERISDEEVVRQTLAEGEETVKQWSDLLKPSE